MGNVIRLRPDTISDQRDTALLVDLMADIRRRNDQLDELLAPLRQQQTDADRIVHGLQRLRRTVEQIKREGESVQPQRAVAVVLQFPRRSPAE